MPRMLMPQIDGEWWTVAGDPDMGEFTDPKEQPVDFSVWQAGDGTWQLWSCIRHTRCGGKTRLFHCWEGKHITDPDWQPMGIAMQADAKFGETPGGLQAPHVLKLGDTWHMFYGDWQNICHATSADGKTFFRQLTPDAKAGLFGEGPDANARDPMLLPLGDRYHCYYAAHPVRLGAVYCRISTDLRHWSDAVVVAFGGSADPLAFGVNDDRCLVGTLPVGASEIVEHDGQPYIASLLPSLKGIRIARLKWAERA